MTINNLNILYLAHLRKEIRECYMGKGEFYIHFTFADGSRADDIRFLDMGATVDFKTARGKMLAVENNKVVLR